jgi:hypothetical protein
MGPETVVGFEFSQPHTEFLDIPHKHCTIRNKIMEQRVMKEKRLGGYKMKGRVTEVSAE